MSRTARLGSVLLLTLLGFALRFYQLNHVPLRGDEAFTVIHWMREPLAHTLADIATTDPQAPLSYALFRGWALLMGAQENIARLLPALLNVLGIPVMYALGHRLRGWRLGLLAAALWAINPYQLWHAQDARNYAIWAALSPLAVWLALRALDRGRRIDWILYVVAAALAAYIYYLELLIILALNLYVLLTFRRDRRLLLRWFGAQVVIGLLLAPWYLQPRLYFGSGYGGTARGFEPLEWLTRFLPTLTFADTRRLPPDFAALLVPVTALALLAGLALWWRRRRNQALLAGLMGVLPLLLLGVVSLKLNVFEPRYVLGAAPIYTLILCVLALEARPRLAGIPIYAGAVILSLLALIIYFRYDYPKSPNWRALASYLAARVQPGDWLTQAAGDEAFTFYCNEYAVPANCDDKLPANPQQSQAEIDQLLTERSEHYPALWYVAQPLDWPNAEDAENWLKANMQQMRNTSADGLRVQEFMPWAVPPSEIEAVPLATFGDMAELVGAQSSVEPTGKLTVWLYWRALKTSDTPLKVFVHLGHGSDIAAQDDHYPQYGRISTNSWQAGAVYRDVYAIPLPPVLAEGELSVGFYDPESNRRLPVGDGDSFTIETLFFKLPS
jgi:4-amino-4-deoxy-L-arabinose transferase-like glycosyltransferase